METLHFETLLTTGGLALLGSYLLFIGVFFTVVRVNMLRRRVDKVLEEQYPWREKKGRPWKFYIAMIVLSFVGFCPFLPHIVVTTAFGILLMAFLFWIIVWDDRASQYLFIFLAFMVSFYATTINCELTSLLRYGDAWMSHVMSGFGIRIIIHGTSVIFGLAIILGYSMETKVEYDEGPIRLRHVVFFDHKKLVDELVEEHFPKSRKKHQTH